MAIEHGGDLFAIAREHGWDWRDVLDFSASINPLGPAPGVRAAICRSVERIAHYPEREPVLLRRALAELWDLDESQILPGNGATELIFFAARMFATSEVTLAAPVFQEFHRAFPHAHIADLNVVSSWPQAGLLVLTRPANPSGYTFDLDLLRSRQEPILVDESFLEFTGLPSAATLLAECPGLMILRSLTKFYALPGLRLGALVASAQTMAQWRTQREPWQVNVLAEQAGLAAIADREHAARSVRFVRAEREWLRGELQGLAGCRPRSSDANFLCIDLPYSARRLREHLLNYKILIREVDPQRVRAAVRRRDENARLIAAWKELSCG